MTIKFHFFGKNLIINRSLSERGDLLEKIKDAGFTTDCVMLLNQIHSKEVFVIDDIKKIYGTQNLPKADAIVSNLTNIAIGVFTADCAPILFFDEEKKIIAAVHAGWRGARSGIIENAIREMKKLGAQKIVANIGPMIQQNSYEVDHDFFIDFLNESSSNKIFFMEAKTAGKFLFDLPAYIENKINLLSLVKINNCNIDTYSDKENFFSFRRSTHQKESDCGRNISLIMMQNP